MLRAHFEPTLATIGPTGQTVDREAEVGQDLIFDDVVKKNSIRIEGVLRQDDTIIKCAVLADRFVPELGKALLYYGNWQAAVRMLTGPRNRGFLIGTSDLYGI